MKFINILIEGKKENLIDRYKEVPIFIDEPELLSRIIDNDPSSTKKYSEWSIKEVISFMKINNGASIADVIIQITDLIKDFHINSKSITEDDIDYALKLNKDINAVKIRTGPKDINKYDAYWDLQTVLSAASKRRQDKIKETEVKNDVDRIYEDSRFLIIQPYTHKASCYYGSNTKWCTTTKNNETYFDRYSEDGRLIYVIDKKSNSTIFGKMALHIGNDGKVQIYDQEDSPRSLDYLLQSFEPIAATIEKVITGDDDYMTLKRVLGKELNPNNQKLSAKYFSHMTDTTVYLKFDDVEEYMGLLSETLDEYEIQSYVNAIDIPYGYDNYYYDSYTFDEDMSEGYVAYNFNDEHLKLIQKILRLTGSDVAKCLTSKPNVSREKLKKFIEAGNDVKDYNDLYTISISNEGNCHQDISKYLIGFDEATVSQIGDAYSVAKDESMKKGVKEELETQLCNIYEGIGFVTDTCFYDYQIPISTLIEGYEDNLDHYGRLTLNDFLLSFVENEVSFSVEEPHQMAWEVGDDEETFNYHFNDDVTRALENLLEKIETSEDYLDLEEYKLIHDKITKNYGFETPIEVETTDEDVTLNLISLDPEDNKVSFELRRNRPHFKIKTGKAKFSTIQKMLTNYQLFDLFDD